jgi:ABC-type nickel/cobalt efflux system permease component RcnA
MKQSRNVFFAVLSLAAIAAAHPMGNFSINHYARITVEPQSVEVLYVLDVAELPTLQLMQKWNVTKDSPHAQIDAAAHAQAVEWVKGLRFVENGAAVLPRLERTEAVVQDGAGGLAVVRINSYLRLPARTGKFEYQDSNFSERAGWKEVVVVAADGSSVTHAEPAGADRTKALTAYPQDPTLAPPQDTSAHFEMTVETPVTPLVTHAVPSPVAPAPGVEASHPVATAVATPVAAPVATAATPLEAQSLGTVKRDDFLSRTLKNSHTSLPLGLALICLAVAFGIGALHAIEPGHGKTMVAAYLVGSRGTFKQAIFLGGLVTFTHTISVFALGLITLFLSQYVLPETMTKVLGVISGVSIIWIGALLLYRRARKLFFRVPVPVHAHHHHDHGHTHHHHHDEHHTHTHVHTHTHDGHTHSHVPEGDVSLGSLIALGVTGGLVPCPAALVLLLSCISIGRTAFGLLLLISFSLGLALVLMLIGVMVLVVKKTVPKSSKPSHVEAWVRFAPLGSAAAIFAIGVYMTGVAVGAFPVIRVIG